MPEKQPVECTNPESPDFALMKRKMEWDSKKVYYLVVCTHTHTHTHKLRYHYDTISHVCIRVLLLNQKESTPEPPLKSRPAPPADHPVFQPELPRKVIAVQPFSFESRYEGKPTREDIVEDELKKQAKELAEVCICL